MECIDGITLQSVIGNWTSDLYKGTHEEVVDRLCSISYQLCEGLQHIHSHGIVFQDVKPGNIMITKDYIVKIIDFGLARKGK